jgi:DNA invertase Pin-like site-specific DNA recombinase
MTKPIHAALYARVSTVNKGQNPEMQIGPMLADCERRGWSPEVYQDFGSGAEETRAELERLWRDVRAGKVDVVMVWKFDRFARSLRHLVAALEEFRARGIQFISVQDGQDTSTPQGTLLFHIIAAMAEFERALIRERVTAGIDHARKCGRKLGRPAVEVDRVQVTAMRKKGASWAMISETLGISYGTARRAFLAGNISS